MYMENVMSLDNVCVRDVGLGSAAIHQVKKDLNIFFYENKAYTFIKLKWFNHI